MAEYLIQGETLTNMADEIRTLSGTTGTMNPNEMTEHVADANAEITSQDALLDQAIAALEGKAAGSGGGSVETCTVTITGDEYSARPDYIFYMTNEDVPDKVITNNSSLSVTLQNVLCGSVFIVSFWSSSEGILNVETHNAELIASRGHTFVAFRITASSGGTVEINNKYNSSSGSND